MSDVIQRVGLWALGLGQESQENQQCYDNTCCRAGKGEGVEKGGERKEKRGHTYLRLCNFVKIFYLSVRRMRVDIII